MRSRYDPDPLLTSALPFFLSGYDEASDLFASCQGHGGSLRYGFLLSVQISMSCFVIVLYSSRTYQVTCMKMTQTESLDTKAATQKHSPGRKYD